MLFFIFLYFCAILCEGGAGIYWWIMFVWLGGLISLFLWLYFFLPHLLGESFDHFASLCEIWASLITYFVCFHLFLPYKPRTLNNGTKTLIITMRTLGNEPTMLIWLPWMLKWVFVALNCFRLQVLSVLVTMIALSDFGNLPEVFCNCTMSSSQVFMMPYLSLHVSLCSGKRICALPLRILFICWFAPARGRMPCCWGMFMRAIVGCYCHYLGLELVLDETFNSCLFFGSLLYFSGEGSFLHLDVWFILCFRLC